MTAKFKIGDIIKENSHPNYYLLIASPKNLESSSNKGIWADYIYLNIGGAPYRGGFFPYRHYEALINASKE